MGSGFRVSLVCSSIVVVVKTGVPSEVHKLYFGCRIQSRVRSGS